MPNCPRCDGTFTPDDQFCPHCGFVFKSTLKLKEQVTFDPHGIINTDWHSYPILRFCDAPEPVCQPCALLNRMLWGII